MLLGRAGTETPLLIDGDLKPDRARTQLRRCGLLVGVRWNGDRGHMADGLPAHHESDCSGSGAFDTLLADLVFQPPACHPSRQ
jgi:hypothetical protein